MVEKILGEAQQDNSVDKMKKFEVCMRELIRGGLSESSQKKLAAQLIEKMDKGGLRHNSLIEQLAVTDIRNLTMLRKREKATEMSTNFADNSSPYSETIHKVSLDFLHVTAANLPHNKTKKLEYVSF